MRIKNLFVKGAILLVLALSTVDVAKAASESYIQTLTGKIRKGDSCMVIDDKFLHLPLADWNQLRHLSVDNIVSFDLRFDTVTSYFNRSFTCSLNISIKYYTSRDQQTPDEINNVDLVVKYDSARGSMYPVSAMHKFKNAFKVVVVVNSITSAEWGEEIPAIFRLKNQILVERKYPFPPVLNGGFKLDLVTAEAESGMAAQRVALTQAGRQLLIDLEGSFTNPEEYDIEWTYIDGESAIADAIKTYKGTGGFTVPDNLVEGWMRNNSTRVTVATATYTINLPYSTGYVLVRARGAYYQTTPAVRIHTPWEYRNEGNYTALIEIVDNEAHEPGINWQYTSAFAEEGKRKEVITYFDGSLRSRQSITLSKDKTLIGSSSDKQETAIAQETIYDEMGRAAVSILPAPQKDKDLRYIRGLNLNSVGETYSHLDITIKDPSNPAGVCLPSAKSLSNSSGASQYYSTNNPFKEEEDFYFTKYVPKADNYPYALTQYTPDNTGRIRRQGGVGEAFQIGKGRETQYFYAKAQPKELVRLFGSEVGDATHYLKNMVVDPNGQVSVTYIDSKGRTVATALAGDPPKTTAALEGAGAESTVDVEQELISPKVFQKDVAGMTMQATATFVAALPGPFEVKYNINPASLKTTHGEGEFCSNCFYKVDIEVRNDCGDIIRQASTTAFTLDDFACNPNAAPVTGSVDFSAEKIGEYSVTYTMRLDPDAVKRQVDYYIANNSDLETLNDFFNRELEKLKPQLAGCYTTCEECKALGETPDKFRAKVLEFLGEERFAGIDPVLFTSWINSTWTYLTNQCQLLSCTSTGACEDYLAQMKEDVKPGGQYALFNYNEEDDTYSFVDPDINVMRFYKDPIDNADIYGLEYLAENGEMGLIRNLSESNFIKEYIKHPEWADLFVKKHIEYCGYEWCKDESNSNKNEESYNFDKTLKEVYLTGERAVSAGYLSGDFASLLTYDPFFKVNGRGYSYKDQMFSDLQHFSTAIGFEMRNASNAVLPDKNLLLFVDWLLYCKPTASNATADDFASSWTSCVPSGACRSRTAEWELYRNYYLQLKSKYLELVKGQVYPNCKNCFIGKDPLMENKCIAPSSVNDYSIISQTEEGKLVYKIVYRNHTQVFPENYTVNFQYVKSGATTSASVSLVRGAVDQVAFVSSDGPLTSISITNVSCPAGSDLPGCSLTGGTAYCPNDSFFYLERVPRPDLDEIHPTTETFNHADIYLNYTGPALVSEISVNLTLELRPDIGYSSQFFYSTVSLLPGQTRIFVGEDFTIWQDQGELGHEDGETTYYITSLPTGVAVCPPMAPASSCVNDPNYGYYAGKTRIFSGFVSLDRYKDCLSGSATAAPSEAEIVNALRPLVIEELDGLKETWKEQLTAVRDEEATLFGAISDASIDQLVNALYQVAKKNIEIAQTREGVRPTSTLPVGVNSSLGHNSFLDAFNAIIGTSLVGQGFSPYLLAKPYPLGKTPIEVNPNGGELTTAICNNLTLLKNRYNALGTGSFYNWLKGELEDDLTLTEGELTDLENRCQTGCKYLNAPVLLPAVLASPAMPNNDHPFVNCSQIGSLETAFGNLFPSLLPDSRLYRTLYANYMNHQLGYSLGYIDYAAFKNKCISSSSAVLYNKVSNPIILPDDLDCVKSGLLTAYERSGQEYDRYITLERERFRRELVNKCIENTGSASLQGQLKEYHYTLYYYDQSGNLVKTIPPAGVKLLEDEDVDKVLSNQSIKETTCTGVGIPTSEQKASTLQGFSSRLLDNSLQSTEMWLYNGSNAGDRQVRFVTPDNRYLYQTAIHDHRLWVELYVLQPDQSGGISITLSKSAVADFSQLPLQPWSHLVVQSSTFATGTWDLYLDGQKLSLLTNGPAYPFEWQIQGGSTLPADQLADLKHLRIYSRMITGQEVANNYASSCLAPVQSVVGNLLTWGRFNIPVAGSETTTGPEATTEFVNRFVVPKHLLPTTYKYNSFNKVVEQTSPDGGTSKFWYDRLGRLVISQNSEQLTPSIAGEPGNRFSYSKYDELGRIVEVGEKTGVSSVVSESSTRSENLLNSFYGLPDGRQVVQTLYDASPADAPAFLTYARKRVVASLFRDEAAGPVQHATYYSYDISGNAKTIYQHIAALTALDPASGIKRIDYEYDLISGKTNMVKYQEGKGDQFYYRYQYDGENRLVSAETSRDKLIWNLEASYRYYLHGPLARLELGAGKVQGIDYAYTLQGWLKGVNSQQLSVDKDMSEDGKPGSPKFPNNGRDVMAYSLGYFDNDYNAIDGGPAFSMKYTHPTAFPNTATGNQLYNGNISNITLALSKLDNGATKGYSYRYDQLNRLTNMRMHAIGSGVANWDNTTILDTYKEDITYDANGNILTYTRNGNKAGNLLMDKLSYNYHKDGTGLLSSNKLLSVDDEVVDGLYTNDIDDQNDNNYSYDKIGNLLTDVKEKLESVKWTVGGKIASIAKGGNGGDHSDIMYGYDANGNRAFKSIVFKKAGGSEFKSKTFYVRDPQGNVLGVYKLGEDNKLRWLEQNLYGSSRLGVWKSGLEVTPTWQAPTDGTGIVTLGQREYELSNHLGNVLAVISDKKLPLSGGGFEAEVLTTSDYYPFGMQMPGRSPEPPGCRDVTEDLIELKASSDLNSGVTTPSSNVFVQNGITWQKQANGIITYQSGAIRCENSGTSGSDGVLAIVPSSMLKPDTYYVMECDIVDKASGITSFGINAQSGTLDPYRTSVEVSGTGHQTIFFKTGVVMGNWTALRISARPSTAGLWFVVDNLTVKEHKGVTPTLLHGTDFNAAVMNGVNVENEGVLWKPFNSTTTTLSVVGSTDKKIQVNCTTVNDSRLNAEFANVTGGSNYQVKFSMTEPEADKRLFLSIQSRAGTGAWTYFVQGIFYSGSGDYHYNFIVPTGADQVKVEFLRTSTGSAIDGLNVPYTIDNFSITKLKLDATRTTRVCDPGASETGENSLYRYGFNGKENDSEVKGFGNQQDYGMRIYDPRLGRFLSVDPITKKYPELTPYQFASNSPVSGTDLDGLEYVTAIYKVTIFNGLKTVKAEYVWHNSLTHSEYGELGMGVNYEINIHNFDDNKFTSRSYFVSRGGNSSASYLTQYGNYMGSYGLCNFNVYSGDPLPKTYRYDVPAVDYVDEQARLHDLGYDRVMAVGASGLFSDFATTPYDEAALNGWKNYLNNYKVGESIDPVNKEPVRIQARHAAWRGITLFSAVVNMKIKSISDFMNFHYETEASFSTNLNGARVSNETQRRYNYELFLKKYMDKDPEGNWIRKEGMWEGDEKKGYRPIKPKK